MRRVAVVVLGVLVALLVVAQAQTQESEEVLFEAKGVGKLAGKALSKESVVFYGLRYANSPVESLRWKAPKPFHYPADSFINATQVAPICPQKASGFGEQVQTISEDCLFVNVWVPRSQVDALNAKQKTEPLSVMVFIHGGAFVIGSGTDPYVAGEAFNERNTILVTFNYRLGPFGFFIHPALRQQDPDAFANFGLLDQKQAFRWIRENIGAFGGNPNSVTVFGESAGGMSIEWLLTSAKPDGTFEKLFDRAIIQSAPVGRALSNEHALDLSHQILERSGWTDPATINSPQAIEWLRAQPIDTILNSLDGFGIHRTLFWHTSPDSLLLPTVDGKQFPEDPRTAFEDGKHWAKGIDVVIGTTRDEGTLFMFLTFALSELTQDHYEDGVRTAFNITTIHEGKTVNAGDVILKQYENTPPLNPGKTSEVTPLDKVSAVINDFSFQCGTDRVAKAISRDSRVYKYLFNHMAAGGHQNIGVYHAADLPFFFRTTPGAIFLKSFTDEELALSNLIIDQLVSFSSTGSFTDAVSWPVFTAANDATLLLELPQPRIAVDYKKDTCTFWNNLLPHGPPYEKADTMKAESLQSWILNAVVLRTLIMYGKYIKPLVVGLAILIVIWILRCCFFGQKKKPAIVAAKASKKRA